MKVLVVGSNGFLGKHVKNLLHKENKYNVLEITGKEQVDITQYHSLSKYMLENKPNIIINCAAFVGGISYGYQYPAKLLLLLLKRFFLKFRIFIKIKMKINILMVEL